MVHKMNQQKAKVMTENKSIENFVKLLQELRGVDPEFPIHYAFCLAEISRDEGLSLTTLSERTQLPLSTVSRIVGALSQNRQKGMPYGLVEVKISRHERRRKELSLSSRGQKIIQNLCAILGEQTQQEATTA